MNANERLNNSMDRKTLKVNGTISWFATENFLIVFNSFVCFVWILVDSIGKRHVINKQFNRNESTKSKLLNYETATKQRQQHSRWSDCQNLNLVWKKDELTVIFFFDGSANKFQKKLLYSDLYDLMKTSDINRFRL